MSSTKFTEARGKYPVLEKYAYLDTATTGLISEESFNSMSGFLEKRYREGMDIPDYQANWKFADDARALVAEAINAGEDEIFYADNCSAILNVFSTGVTPSEGGNVITTDLSFPSTPYTWMNQAGKGIETRVAKSAGGEVPYVTLIDLVDERTFALSLCAVENTSGFRHDLKRIGTFCRENNIYLAVDATQCIGALEIDVQAMNIDFLAVSSYKWLNNVFGIGFGYVSRELMKRIDQQYAGWVGNKDRFDHSRIRFDLDESARRYEMGGLNWIGLHGMKEALGNYLSLGKKETEEYILGLTRYLYKKVEDSRHIGVVGPFQEENRSGITYIYYPPEWRLNDGILRENGIRAHVASGNQIRVSVHFYNNTSDVDRLFDFLDTYKG